MPIVEQRMKDVK